MGRSFAVWTAVALSKDHLPPVVRTEKYTEMDRREREEEAGGGPVYLYKPGQGPDKSHRQSQKSL